MNTKVDVTTNGAAIDALVASGIPKRTADDVLIVFPITDLRRVIRDEDAEALKIVKNVGDKRAALIIETLRGRIPEVMSKPCPDIKKPDIEMYEVPNMNLVYDEKPCLTRNKWEHGEQILEDDEPVRDIAKKRYGPALQKLQQISGEKRNVVFTTTSEIENDKDRIKGYELEAYWKKVVHNGLKLKDGKVMRVLAMGTNAKMKCQLHWADERFIEEVRKWMACGARFDNAVNIAKIEAYFGLLLPYTHQLLNGVMTPDMEVLIESWEKEHSGKNLFIQPNGVTEWKDMFTVNEFDGILVCHLTENIVLNMNLSRPERRALRRAIAKFNGGTIRAPWQKGLIVYGFDIHAALHDMGVDSIGGKNINDIALFGDMSVFKAAIGDNGLYKKFEDYCVSFKAMKHRFGVLLENHGVKKSFLPAQQLQAAHGANPEFIKNGAEEEVKYLNASCDAKTAAVRYAQRPIARIAQKDSSIMNVWFAQERANRGYQKERLSALAGRTHGNSVTGFVVKDVVAFAQWIAYKEGKRTELPTGCLGAYEVYAPTAGFTGEAVGSRNPVIANYGLKLVNVVDSVKEYDKYFDEGFDYVMTSVHDDLCKLLRMDHDGDKMRLTHAKWFIDAVKSIETDGFAEWTSFGKVAKVPLTKENREDFYGACTATPTLGLNVDTCGRMITNGIINKPIHEMAADYLMNKGTDVKQGADGSSVSGYIGHVWYSMLKDNRDSKWSIAQAFGKKEKGRTIKEDRILHEYGDSNLDIISKAVNRGTPKTLKFTPGMFNVELIIKNKLNLIPGLVGLGRWNEQTEKYDGEGLFDRIAGRTAKDWDAIDDSVRKNSWAEYSAWKKDEALKEMYEFAESVGATKDDVYDTLVTYVFVTLSRIWHNQNTSEGKRNWLIILSNFFVDWFGDEMEEVFRNKMSLESLPGVGAPVEIEEDVFF